MLKIFFTVISLLSLSLMSLPSMAATWYGFCYGKKSGRTFCSNIELKTPTFSFKCGEWAKSHGATVWGNKTATTTEQLSNQQASMCQEIIGDDPNPPTTNFECYVVSYCPNSGSGTPTSGIRPISLSVSANDKNEAVEKCGNQGKNIYIDDLKSSSLSDCFTQIQAH